MITAQIEKLSDALPELKQVIPIQHGETGDSDLPCDPMWNTYVELERAGCTLLTMRENGRLIGFAACMIHRHINSKDTLVGSIPTFWVEQRPNRALLLRSILQRGANLLWRKGAQQVTFETEIMHSCGRLLEMMGARVGKIGYVIKRHASVAQEASNA